MKSRLHADMLLALGKSHMSKSLWEISSTIDPETVRAHPRPDDDLWLDRAQEWRTRLMKHVGATRSNREAGGMDVSHFVLACVYV